MRSTYNSATKSIGILQAVEDYIAARYDAADFRPTPDLFNGVENVALQYAFTYLGYTQQTELSTWVPVAGRTPETLLASFRQNKKQDVKKALKQDLTFRKLETRAEIDAFHALLRQNLQKFGVEPVHTADELWEFKTSRLPDIAGFYGVFADEQMVAGGMTFYFARPTCCTPSIWRRICPSAVTARRRISITGCSAWPPGWAATPCPGASRRRNAARC